MAERHTADRQQRYPRRRVVDERLVGVDLGGGKGALLLDLSEGGAGLQLYDTLLETGSPTLFRFDSPDGRIETDAIVAWVGDGGRAGIRFVNVAEDTAKILRSWLETPGHLPEAGVDGTIDRSETSGGVLDTTPLRTVIALNVLDRTASLNLISRQAREIIGANGLAIALGRPPEIICQAADGNAPAAGSPVNLESGLTALCVRNAEVVFCRDTQHDERVDAEICRAMGIRSVIVVPVLIQQKVRGIVTAFSSRPHGFGPRDISDLQQISLLVAEIEAGETASVVEEMTASKVASLPVLSPAKTPEPRTGPLTAPEPYVGPIQAKPAQSAQPVPQPGSQPKSGTQGGLLEIQSLAAWTAPQDAGEKSEVHAAVTPAEKMNTGETVDLFPSFTKSERIRTPRVMLLVLLVVGLLMALVGISRTPDLPRAPEPVELVAPVPAPATVTEQPKPVSPPHPSTTVRTEKPLKPVVINENWKWVATATSDGLAEVVSAKFLRDSAPTTASAEINPGELLLQVDPAFPVAAEYGDVVVRATVSESGRVIRVESIRGDPKAIAAAEKAISQWRYRPATRNGHPIQNERLITIQMVQPLHPDQPAR